MKTERLSSLALMHSHPGVYEGGPRPPPLRLPPLRGWEGALMREALLILHLLAFPFLRPGTVAYLGGSSPIAPPPGSSRRGTAPPPGKYKIKRKLRLKSNTWQWQRLRNCLNSLLIQGVRSFSLLKRILHYTRCTMTESRLNDLALKALHPKRLPEEGGSPEFLK